MAFGAKMCAKPVPPTTASINLTFASFKLIAEVDVELVVVVGAVLSCVDFVFSEETGVLLSGSCFICGFDSSAEVDMFTFLF